MMTLAQWIKSRNLTLDEAARLLSAANASVVRRWASGTYIPRPEFMRKIYAVTGGQVTPNDFYQLPSIPAVSAAMEGDNVRPAA